MFLGLFVISWELHKMKSPHKTLIMNIMLDSVSNWQIDWLIEYIERFPGGISYPFCLIYPFFYTFYHFLLTFNFPNHSKLEMDWMLQLRGHNWSDHGFAWPVDSGNINIMLSWSLPQYCSGNVEASYIMAMILATSLRFEESPAEGGRVEPVLAVLHGEWFIINSSFYTGQTSQIRSRHLTSRMLSEKMKDAIENLDSKVAPHKRQ